MVKIWSFFQFVSNTDGWRGRAQMTAEKTGKLCTDQKVGFAHFGRFFFSKSKNWLGDLLVGLNKKYKDQVKPELQKNMWPMQPNLFQQAKTSCKIVPIKLQKRKAAGVIYFWSGFVIGKKHTTATFALAEIESILLHLTGRCVQKVLYVCHYYRLFLQSRAHPQKLK